jgi:aspartate aminotransferase-like enzyme
MAMACRNASSALGLELFPRSHPSQALTAVTLPSNIDGSLLVKLCREKYGAIFAGGQDHLKGKIVRIAHLGLVDQLDIIGAIAAFEMGLKTLGYKHDLGCGVSAAMQTLSET